MSQPWRGEGYPLNYLNYNARWESDPERGRLAGME